MAKRVYVIFSMIYLLFSLCLIQETKAQNAQTYLNSGIKKYSANSFTEAIQDFTKAIQINYQLEEAYYHRAEAYFQIERFAEAVQDFTKSIELKPTQAMSYFQRGLAQVKLGNDQVALWDFNKAIELSPKFEASYIEKADVYRILGRYNQAMNDCNEALNIAPNSAKAFSIRGLIKLAQFKTDEAYTDLFQAVKISPNDASFRNNLAAYYKVKNQTERAIEEYSAAINLDANNSEAFFHRAILKLSLGNNSDAQKDANKAIQNNRRYLEAHVIRGIASFNLGEYPRYEYDFNHYYKYAKLSKDFYFLAYHVNQFAKEGAILNEAETCAFKSVQMDANYENHLLYGNVLYKLNKTTLARDYAEKAVDIAKRRREDPTHAQSLLGKIARENTDKDAPTIRITSPIASNRGVILVESTNKITVIGQALDESGISKVLLNGNPARISKDGNFDGEAILKTNENSIVIEAIDSKGNKATKTIGIEKQKKDILADNNVKKIIGGTHYALLFATNNYESWGTLINPIPDAEAIKKDLELLYGFKVEICRDMNKEDMMLKIKSYAKKQYESNDELFIFFAGHGQYDEVFKEGYVVAKDSKYEDESRFSYISHSNLRTYINSIPCKHVFLMMDVCFGGTFDPVIASTDRAGRTTYDKDKEEMINRKLRYTTRRYLTSGGKEYVPDGAPGKHSPFVRKFLEALRSEGGQDKVLTLAEIIDLVAPVHPQPQSGEFGSNEPGSDFLFIVR